MRPGSSDPSTKPVDMLNIPNIAITDRNLEDGKRFALYLQGLLHLPATHASFITPLATKPCSHKILQERCLTRPTPWRWMPLAAELSQRRCMVHLKHVIHSTSLHNKIPSEVPLEHAYTSASALERETSFCVLKQEYKRHPPRKMVAQETGRRLVLSLAQSLSVKTSMMLSPGLEVL